MPKITIGLGLLMIALAIAALVSWMREGTTALTAIVPFVVGDAFIAAGACASSRPEHSRRIMRVAAVGSAVIGIVALLLLIVFWNSSDNFTRAIAAALAWISTVRAGWSLHGWMSERKLRRLGLATAHTVADSGNSPL